MQSGDVLQFDCQACQKPINFSIFQFDKSHDIINCQHCKKKYAFTDENLKRQLKKFELLCRQIQDSEEILANTHVGIDVSGRQVKIPYKLLLTRLNSYLQLKMGDQTINISFRLEPLTELK